MPSSTLFTDAMALSPAGDGVYDGELNEHWTIGPKVHGGAMLALCANAAVQEHGGVGAPSQAEGTPPRSVGECSRLRCRATSCWPLSPARCEW